MPPPEQHTPSPDGAGAAAATPGGLCRTTGRCGSPRRANASISAITTETTTTAATTDFVHAMVAIVIGSGRWLG